MKFGIFLKTWHMFLKLNILIGNGGNMLNKIKPCITKYKNRQYTHSLNNLDDRVDDFRSTIKLCESHMFRIQSGIRDSILTGDILSNTSDYFVLYYNDN